MIRPLYRLLALCLALAWLPAVVCCTMEAAGWGVLCSDANCHGDTSDQPADGCNLVEEGGYQSAIPLVKIAPSLAALCACFVSVQALRPEPERVPAGFVSETVRPPDWVPTWAFARRAAAPAHAPDPLNG